MSRALTVLIGAGCLLALLLACFGAVLFEDQQFSYRDAGHFYYPLYRRVQQEWAAGRLPLWEPEENGGMPLLGNPTAAVLYPGKLIFAVPGLSYPWGMRLYVIAHAALAVAGMILLLRSWRVSPAGSILGGLAYGFGAPILFQYCNIIFLVGAAWAPFGLRSADRWVRLGKRRALLELAAVLALQVLGGDPEAAYLVGLCAVGYALGLAWARGRSGPSRRSTVLGILGSVLIVGAWVAITLALVHILPGFRPKREPPPVLPWTPYHGWALLIGWAVVGLLAHWAVFRKPTGRATAATLWGLAGSAVLAAMLAAVQLVPVVEFTSRTARAAPEATHDIFPFSLEPWRLAELAWPEVFGNVAEGSHSWLGALGSMAPQIWVPSLYLGALPLVLASAGLGLRGESPGRAWLSIILVVSLLGAFGQFASPIWVARWSPALVPSIGPHDPPDVAAIRRDGWLRDGEGSPYGLLALILPGFQEFRYPSKLLTFTALALAGLAGIGWDRVVQGDRRRALIVASGLVIVGVLVGIGWGIGRDRIIAALAETSMARSPSIFGPFDARGAWAATGSALIRGASAATVALVLIVLAGRGWRWAGPLALIALTLDLAIANAPLVRSIPQAAFETRPAALQAIEADAQAHPMPGGKYRVHRMPLWHPPAWYLTVSPDRHNDFVRWERRTIQPKYAIPDGLQYTYTEGTAELYDFEFFFAPFRGVGARSHALAERIGLPKGTSIVAFPRRGFDLWNTRYFLVPMQPANTEQRGFYSFLPRSERVVPDPGIINDPERARAWARDEDWQLFRNNDAYPRAWIVHRMRATPPIAGLRRADRIPLIEEMLYPGDDFWTVTNGHVFNPRQVAWVETDDPRSLIAGLSGAEPDPAESATVRSDDPQRVEIDVKLNSPGLVVLADIFYPGWELTIDGKPAPIYRTNRAMRGAAVPSGDHRLVYTYRPGSVRLGGWISGLGVLAALGLGFWSWRRPVATGGPLR